MTEASWGILKVAIMRLDAAHEVLDELPLTTEVRALSERWVALHTVLLGIVNQRGPTLDDAQRARLLDSIWTFALEVDDARARLG